MTYCLGIKLAQASVMISDSRTSAGVDNISTYSKMWRFGVPGNRQFVLCSAGNLATTQSVVATIERDIKSEAPTNLNTVVDMKAAAEYIGAINVDVSVKAGGGGVFESTFLLAGEILGAEHELLMIYPQGNFIASSQHVPYMQIGETKYGKPILDRVVDESTTVEEAIMCGLISMEATMKSNLSVGPPIEISTIERGSLQPGIYKMLGEDDKYLRNLRDSWNSEMIKAIHNMPMLKL